MRTARTPRFAGLCLLLLSACGAATPASHGPDHVDIPVLETPGRAKGTKKTVPKESPPPSGAAKESRFPSVERATLPNGLRLAVASLHALPVVQVRLLVGAGAGFGPSPGVAFLTGQLAKEGGTRSLAGAELIRRIETVGASLTVTTDQDATVLSTAVPRDQLSEVLALLAQIVREPRLDDADLKKLEAREADRAADAARSNGAWVATRTIFRELFPEKSAYATYGLVPSEITRVDASQIREFHRRFWIPRASELVLAGDVDLARAKSLAETHFGRWAGSAPERVDIAPARAVPKTRVVVAHRPKSVQSDVYVASLAVERRSASWPAFRVANQVLGGGVAGRLFADVREKRSLAYRTYAQVFELASGPQPLVLYAGTETAKTAETVLGLLDNFASMTASPPTPSETESARRYLADIYAVRMETASSIADLVVVQDTFGLPDGYWDAYRRELRSVDAEKAGEAWKKLYGGSGVLVVVAGDADLVAPALARFGEVLVVDPEKEFKPR